MEFKKMYFFAHIFITFLAFIAFMLIVIGLVDIEHMSNAVLSMVFTSIMLIILSIFLYRKTELERISVFYSIALFAMLVVLSVVTSIGQ